MNLIENHTYTILVFVEKDRNLISADIYDSNDTRIGGIQNAYRLPSLLKACGDLLEKVKSNE